MQAIAQVMRGGEVRHEIFEHYMANSYTLLDATRHVLNDLR